MLVAALLIGCGSGDADGGTPAAGGSGDEATTAPPGTEAGGDDGGGERVTIGDAEALVWGEGTYGVVLAHGAAFDAASWSVQALAIADAGMVVVAVEDISPGGVAAAADYLKDQRGATDVALVGGSAGAGGIMQAVSGGEVEPDQLILLSPNSVVEGLGTKPKLFIASEEESVADVSTRLAEESDGDENEVMLLPGSAHAQNIFDTDQGAPTLQAVLDRLAEFANA